MQNFITSRPLANLAFLTSLALASPTVRAEQPAFLTPTDINLLQLLPPPPANGSSAFKRELQELERLQAQRTKARVAQAIADQEETIWRFLEGMGKPIDKTKIPLAAKFYRSVLETVEAITRPAKEEFKRVRPPYLDAKLKPVVKLSKSYSHPSTHASYGMATAIILADMIPEWRASILERGRDFGVSRMVGGVHYPTDVEAGRVTGTLIAQALFHKPAFKTQFDAAKAEMRTALGLPDT
jgi:acid phosphatase (class A)